MGRRDEFENTNPSTGARERGGSLAPLLYSVLGILIIVIVIGALAFMASGDHALTALIALLWSSLPLFFALLLFFFYCGHIARRAQTYSWLRPIMAVVAFGAAFWFILRIMAVLHFGLVLPAWFDGLGDALAVLVFLCLLLVALLAIPIRPLSTPPSSPAPPGAPGPGGVRRLYRSAQDQWVAGVCGGLGEYFTIDPVLVRGLFILFVLASMGLGVIFYLLLWVVVPRNPRTSTV